MKKEIPDLQKFIDAASDEARQESAAPNPKKVHSGLWVASVCAVLLSIVLFGNAHRAGISWFMDKLAPSRVTRRAQSDLETTLAQVRDSLENARNSDGSLPNTLPNAAFAAVVNYFHYEASYELSASAHGVTVSLDNNGDYIVIP